MLLETAQKRFPPRRKSKGWILTGRFCKKPGCQDCPHELGWRFYIREEGRPWYPNKGKREKRLPRAFWVNAGGKRKPETVLDFRKFDEDLQRLNKEWADVQKVLADIYKKLRACYNRLL